MTGSDNIVFPELLLRVFVIALYAPVGFVCYRWLVPRLTSICKLSVTLLFAAQLLVITLSLELRPTGDLESWMWDLGGEFNLPALLASAQLALVGGVALLTAFLAKEERAWRRLYFVGVGWVFVHLARDEFFHFHELIPGWQRQYALLGAGLVAATLLMLVRSPRRHWRWHICLIAGLAISAAGAVVVDEIQQEGLCISVAQSGFEGCLWSHIIEESFEFVGVWLALVAMHGHYSAIEPMPTRRIQLAIIALPLLWVFLLTHQSLAPTIQYLIQARPASVQFENRVGLSGYRADRDETSVAVQLFSKAKRRDAVGAGFSLHLIDQATGKSLAGKDERLARFRQFWHFGLRYERQYRQTIAVQYPRPLPANRAIWLVLTAWQELDSGFKRQMVVESDRPVLGETQVILAEFVIPSAADPAAPEPLARFDGGLALEALELPESARAGEMMALPVAWRSDADGSENYIQFLHLQHEETGEWWVYDQQPLGPRLPTRLWYAGLADQETWGVPLPVDLRPGAYHVYTGLYRARDRERLPARDRADRYWTDARVSVSRLIVN